MIRRQFYLQLNSTLQFLLLASALVWAASCRDKQEACVFIPETKDVEMELTFEQCEDSLLNFHSKQDLVSFLKRHGAMADYFFRRQEYPNDSAFVNQLFLTFNHPGFDTLLMETKKVFGDMSALKEEFRQAFTNLKYYYPDFTPPQIQTAISGLQTDLWISDTLIIVGLDYYLGKEGKYRPRIYDYLLTRYEPEDIVPSALLIYGISDRFNKTVIQDKTALADMVAYGKSFYFAKHMLPCVPDSVFIWYSAEEIEGARMNQDLIWQRFVDDEVLFSTSHETKQKFLNERPKTIEVGEKCPGRIGQWVGWQIVNNFMEKHPEMTLSSLMELNNAQHLFKESRYKPKGK